MIMRPSPNFEPRPAGAVIDMLVLHYTGMTSAQGALDRLCDPAAKVSAHYVIDEDGTTYALVDEAARAWHAGVSWWRGQGDANSRSIGIELVNPGHEFGYRPFPAAQMAALIDLARGILSRHPAIEPRNVVAHADLAPARKEDPGELFDWPLLAANGIGVWPSPRIPTPTDLSPERVRALLTEWGYDPTCDLTKVMTAFQRHFRPQCWDGQIDGESVGMLLGLTSC